MNQLCRCMEDTASSSRNCIAASLWWSIVDIYSGLALTRDTDKLIALSGIVEIWREIIGESYIVGLWKGSLLTDLLWSAKIPEVCCQADDLAPSWLWASVDGLVWR
jgi:hypothetical protein